MITAEAIKILEAVLLCSACPLSVSELKKLFNDEVNTESLNAMLVQLQAQWVDRGLQLVCVSNGWRFQSRVEINTYLERLNPEKQPKYSRAVMETLAIIAYKQPVTRGDIEDIRGVSVSTNVIKVLEERGWIDVIGYRDGPGRPALFATTKQFLDDLGLRTISDLPLMPQASLGGAQLPEFIQEIQDVAQLTLDPDNSTGLSDESH